MRERFVSIWFRRLKTDWQLRRQQDLKGRPFVLAAPDHGKMMVYEVDPVAAESGIRKGMSVADSRAILPGLQVIDDVPGRAEEILAALAEWALRYTPVAAADPPNGLVLEVSGCPHLWGGEEPYLKEILSRLQGIGYDCRAAIADTIGCAWAVARFGQDTPFIASGAQAEALLPLPAAALRLEPQLVAKLEKLGLHQVQHFIHMPRRALRRRFGDYLLARLDQALGQIPEPITPIRPLQPYQERLPSLEPIRTRTGIEIALKQLLEALCARLKKEHKGVRTASFLCYRIDGNIQQVCIGTTSASQSPGHLFSLFELKLDSIEPELGIEMFLLEASVVEDLSPEQDALWHEAGSSLDHADLSELLDRIAGKVGMNAIHRYLPTENYWPERSMQLAKTLKEKPAISWRAAEKRPVRLLPKPERIEVMVPLPDYPPVQFWLRGKLHKVVRAEGPERIEREWWQDNGLHRDYYSVEDEDGVRYWLFRLGHYGMDDPTWHIHGFFA